MKKLNQIIESMALAQFNADIKTKDKMNAFMLKHATLNEFVEYFSSKQDGVGYSWSNERSHGYRSLGELDGLAELFCKEILWVRLKDKYIEDAVKSLEQKVEQSFKITIESI